MGGKRDLRRCTSLMNDPGQLSDDHRKLSEDLLNRAANLRNTEARPFCPITIQIDLCSSDEEGGRPRDLHEDDRTSGGAEDPSGGRKPSPPCERLESDHAGLTPTNQQPVTVGHVTELSSELGPRTSSRKAGRGQASGFLFSPLLSPPSARRTPPSPTLSLKSASFLEVPEESQLSLVKKMAVRLNLRTRSSSVLEWHSKWLDRAHAPPELPVPPEADGSEDGQGGELTEERKERINSALQWLKSELREMQSVDQHIARQLLSLRHEIHRLRLSKSCQQHRDLLDDVQSELEEQEELSDVLDDPKVATLNDTPLRHLGVTRMNLSARRFSTC